MVSSSATPESHFIESISTDQSRSPSLDLVGSGRRKVCFIYLKAKGIIFVNRFYESMRLLTYNI